MVRSCARMDHTRVYGLDHRRCAAKIMGEDAMMNSAASDDTLLLRDRLDRRAAIDRALLQRISEKEAEEREGIVLVSEPTGYQVLVPSNWPADPMGTVWTSVNLEPIRGAQFGVNVDATVYPGYAVDANTLAKERERQGLLRLIDRFQREGFSWVGRDTKIDEAASRAAKALLNMLPIDVALPRVAPDGEGGVLLYWDANAGNLLIVADGSKLHIVERPGMPEAHYKDDVPFDGEVIPPDVISSLPAR